VFIFKKHNSFILNKKTPGIAGCQSKKLKKFF